MIKTIQIKNFRCFKDLYVRDLKPFNVLVGESGSGKTAFLEAIFLAGAASPELWMRLRQWRGSSAQFRLSGTRSSYESLFRDIFYNFEKRQPAKVEFYDSQNNSRSLKVSYPSEEKHSPRSADRFDDSDENRVTIEPIVFSMEIDQRKRAKSEGETLRTARSISEDSVTSILFGFRLP